MTEFFNQVQQVQKEFDEVVSAVIANFFGEPKGLRFNTYVYDMRPTYWEKTKEGYMCLVHTLGIKPDDIKIEVTEDCIRLSAESKYDGLNKPFTKNMDIPVDKDIMSNVIKVKYKIENGLTFIYLDVEHKENNIKVEKI